MRTKIFLFFFRLSKYTEKKMDFTQTQMPHKLRALWAIVNGFSKAGVYLVS